MDIRLGTTLEGPSGHTITIDSLLGRGGFGQVFSGRLPDSTRVAVKTVLTAVLSEDELRSLQNEAKHAIGISHPNVVELLYFNDGEATGGRPPYLVMQFVEGGNLREVIERHRREGKRLSPDGLRALYLQISEGMREVNARIVHRDLKPENVLIDTSTGHAKIADFGLAKLVDATTRSMSFKGWGTRPYQAPEAFEDGPNTPSMDIYAAGVMFYELATFSWPVQPKPGDHSPLAWRNAHLLTPPADIRSIRPDLPMNLVQLIMQMLQKNAARRPPSWDDIVSRLKATPENAGGPDVSALVAKATTTFIQRTQSEVRAREQREREAERTALLEQAFVEPVEVLRDLVDAFNRASAIGKLAMRSPTSLVAEVSGQAGHPRLTMQGKILDDFDTHGSGIVRIICLVSLKPTPSPRTNDDLLRDRDSFGSFNLVYRVQNASERFGEWAQFRFEINPLMMQSSYPRWFGVGFRDLPRELQVLRAMGRHQHEQRQLDSAWFEALLVQML